MKKNDPTTNGLLTSVTINRPVSEVWEAFVSPSTITRWNSATPEWHTPSAENDLRPCGAFNYRREARDGSFGFDFAGVYDEVDTERRIEYTIGDGRRVRVDFEPSAQGTIVNPWFEPESQNPDSMQRDGWQAILDNLRNFVESR